MPPTPAAADGPVQREQNFYDRHWTEAEMSGAERRRISETVAALPGDCQSFLDVGAGDGRLCHAIAACTGTRVVAFDLSRTGLGKIELAERCCGSAARLPFRDRAFDAVVCTEMLEHIPEEWYSEVLRELARVAGKHILVTVPNRENLREHSMLCSACGARSHVWGHCRSYSRRILEDLFPGFRASRIAALGTPDGTYNRAILWARQTLAGAWYWEPGATCSRCLTPAGGAPSRRLGARICDALNARIWARVRRRPSWLVASFERKSAN